MREFPNSNENTDRRAGSICIVYCVLCNVQKGGTEKAEKGGVRIDPVKEKPYEGQTEKEPANQSGCVLS